MNLTLVRYAYLAEATLGWLTAGDLRLATLEEPWIADPDGPGGQRREGQLVESCIPDGNYDVLPHDGAKFQNVWVLVNPRLGVYRSPVDIPVRQPWGRSAVLIHSGNSTSDILGCIAVGTRYGFEANKPWVYESRKALDQLRAVLGRDEHDLTIRPVAGTLEIPA